MGAQLLQVEDDGGTRRDVGAQDSSGKGALRVVAPDAESTLTLIKNAQDSQTTSLGAKLDALLTELQQKLEPSTFAFVVDALKVSISNLPADYPDDGAQTILGQIRDLLDSTGIKVSPTSAELPVKDGTSHTKLDSVRTKLDTLTAEVDAIEESLGTTADTDADTTVIGRLQKLITHTDGVEALLTGLDGKDFATQATLAAVLAAVDGVEALLAELRDTLFRRTDPLAAGSNRIGRVGVDRPTQTSGRTYVSGGGEVPETQGATNTLHTVTPGKVLYLTSVSISALTTQVTDPTNLSLRDDTTIWHRTRFGVHFAGQTHPRADVQLVFPEPKRINTSFVLAADRAGMIGFVSFVGYEE